MDAPEKFLTWCRIPYFLGKATFPHRRGRGLVTANHCIVDLVLRPIPAESGVRPTGLPRLTGLVRCLTSNLVALVEFVETLLTSGFNKPVLSLPKDSTN